jgi:tRNA dimethylallyltransferase
MRALEVVLSTGTSFVAQRQKGEPLVDALQIGIERSREELYERAERAVDEMIGGGWVEEVRGLLAQGITKETPAMSAIGYRELVDVVEGRATLEAVVPMIKQYTRNYSKRQITWFKKDKSIVWVKDAHDACKRLGEWMG